jgi:hypothetical protein
MRFRRPIEIVTHIPLGQLLRRPPEVRRRSNA